MHFAAHDLFAPPPVEILGAGAPELNVAFQIPNHDGFGGKLEQVGARPELFLAKAQLFSALSHSALQIVVEHFQLPGFAVQIDKDADLGAQHLGHNGHGDIVDRAAAVTLDLVGIGEVNSGNENDGCLLKPRVLTDDVGQFKTVQLGHAHIHQHHGNIGFQKDTERLGGSRRLDEILAQLCQNYFVTQQLGWLVIDHQDIDFFICLHKALTPASSNHVPLS